MTSTDDSHSPPKVEAGPLADDAPPSTAERQPLPPADERLAGWTHAWAAAASQTYEVIESFWDDESPASAIGRRDAMSMVLVDAARNVVRGAEALLGTDSAVIRQFAAEHPVLKKVRDYLEHFDDYLRGTGLSQREGRRWGGTPLSLEAAGMDLPWSHGGGPEGHVVQVTVTERAEDGSAHVVCHDVPTRTIAIATRTLARDMLTELGLLDDRHLARCEMCSNPAETRSGGD